MTLPNTMFALALREDGFSATAEGPSIKSLEPYLEAGEIPVPTPADGQALIKVALANINPSDLHFIKGEYGLPRVKGVPAGFEATGEVVAAGEGADGLVGKRVGFIAGGSGAWAEYAIADAAACVPVAEQMRDEDASALFVNPLTAIAMHEEAVRSETPALILSAASSQLCKLIIGLTKDGGPKAIALVRREEQIQHLYDLGAVHVLNTESSDFKREIGEILKNEKPRIFLDAVADQTASDIFFAMPSRARWIIYGKLSNELPTLSQPGQFIFLQKQIEGFWLTKWLRDQSKEAQMAAGMKVQQMFLSGKWETEIADIVPLREAMNKLPGALAGANTGKVMLKP